MTHRLVALAASGLAAAACGGRAGADDWVEVRKDDLVLSVEVEGALEAVDAVPLKPPPVGDRWDFKIARMAPEGAEVKAGEVVLGFDASELVRELERVKTEADAAAKEIEKRRADAAMARKDEALAVATAEAELRKATLKGERPGELTSSLDARQIELDRRLAALQLESTRRKAEQAQRSDRAELDALLEKHAYAVARVKEIEANIERMNVKAPRAGTVIYRSSWRGEKKKVGDSAWRMETVLEVASLDRMIGKGKVDEVDAARVAVGQAVTLRLDAHSEQELSGKVLSLGNTMVQGSPSNPSKVIEIKVALGETRGLPLRPGMRFRGGVETGRVAGAVVVPAEAVFVTAAGPVAYRRRGEDQEKVRLQVGRRNASLIEVKAGLAPGDVVARLDAERASREANR